MFGVSFSEVLVLALIALFVVGPRKLPTILNTLGKWVRKLRHITTEVRTQIGMDDFLRKEGLHGGLTELRGLMRGGLAGAAMSSMASPTGSATRPLASDSRDVADDRTREYPPEGPDAYSALPDDLIDDPSDDTGVSKASTLEAAPSPETPQPETAPAASAPKIQDGESPADASPKMQPDKANT